MPAYRHFEELPVWQEAALLYNLVLDLLETPALPLSPGFRNQLDRVALSVSNNIAEGFGRVTTNELLSFLAIARGSAGEVRSMLAVVRSRPRLRRFTDALAGIRNAAASCARQLTAWVASVEGSPVQGKRRLTPERRAARQADAAREEYRDRFLLSLSPDHPLYDSPEARLARSAAGNSQ